MVDHAVSWRASLFGGTFAAVAPRRPVSARALTTCHSNCPPPKKKMAAPLPMAAGLYNDNSDLQRRMNEAGLKELTAAAAAVTAPGAAVAMADYGCSEGRNSVASLAAAADAALAAGASSVVVTHVDLPSNNWAAFRAAVAAAGASYARPPVVTVASLPKGAGFYEACFPPSSLDLAFGAAAFHWGSGAGLPSSLANGAIVAARGDEGERAAAAGAASADWLSILRLRAAELRPGGRLVACNVVDDGGLDGAWGCLADAWAAAVETGGVARAAVDAAVLRAHLRTEDAWMEPLREGGGAASLFRVVHARLERLTPPALSALRAGTGSAAAYGAWLAAFWEAVSRPVFEAAVEKGRAGGGGKAAVDAFFARVAALAAARAPGFDMGTLVLVLERL